MTTAATLRSDAIAIVTGNLVDGKWIDISNANRIVNNVGGTSQADATLGRNVMRFNTDSQYGEFAQNDSVLFPDQGFAIAFWRRKLDAASRQGHVFGQQFFNHTGSIYCNLPWLDGQIYFRLGNNFIQRNLAGVTSTNWNHWVFQRSGGPGKLQCHLNGTLLFEGSQGTYTRTLSHTEKFRINGTGGGHTGDRCDIADMVLMSRPFTAPEITYLANSANNFNDPLALTVSLNPNEVEAGGTSQLTVTRSGGGVLLVPGPIISNFDSDHSGWTTGLARTTEEKRSGTHSIKSNFLGDLTSSRTFNVDTGGGTLSVWVYNGGLGHRDIRIRVDGVTVGNVSQVTNYQWTELTFNLIAGSRTISFVTYEDDGGGTGYIDDVTVTNVVDAGSINTAIDALPVTLGSSDTSKATVPASLTIAANQTSATATVTGVANGVSTIIASYEEIENSADLTILNTFMYITHNGVVVLVADPALDRISHVGANVLFAEPSYDRISASQIVVVFNDIRYLLSDLLPLTLQPGERVTLKVLAINNFKGPLPATIEIFSNARNHPSFKFRIDSNGT